MGLLSLKHGWIRPDIVRLHSHGLFQLADNSTAYLFEYVYSLTVLPP